MLIDLARKFHDLKSQHEAQSAVIKEIAAAWSACETQLLEAMVEEGVNSVDLIGIGRLSMATKNYLSVRADNKPSFYQYLKSSGNGALLKEDVNPRTLTAFLRGHLEEIEKKNRDAGMDTVDAREAALKFLNDQGASYFSDRGIQFRKES